MLIGIVGALGAGKGTVVDYLKTKGFRHYSSSGYLKEALQSRGIEPNRDAYSVLASEIRAKDPQGLSAILYERYLQDDGGDAVIEALHDVGEVEFVKKHGGVVIGLDANMYIRYERALARGSEKDSVTFKEFQSHIEREEHGGGNHHNIRAALSLADYIIMNDGTIAELHTQIEDVLSEIKKRT